MSGAGRSVRSADQAGVRLELTTAEVRQVWALYSRPLRAAPKGGTTRPPPDGTRPSLGARLPELQRLAWRWRRTLALTSVAALALGAIHLLLATPTFAVTALVLVERRGASAADDATALEAGAFLAGQAEILSDASLVHAALSRSRLGASGDEAVGRDSVARAIDAFSARPVFGTEVIALEYRTQDPAGGVRFVQAMIDGHAQLVRGLGSGDAGVAVRTLAAPARQAAPLWPRPLPVLFASLVLGLLAGLGLAVLAERAEPAEAGWTEIREAAWAG